jgi:hypothetical protein
MKNLFIGVIALFIIVSSGFYAQDNIKTFDKIDLVGGESLVINVDGSGYLDVMVGKKSMNLDYSDASEIIDNISIYEAFEKEVKGGNSAKIITRLGNVITPYLPVNSKLFFVAVSDSSTTIFGFRIVSFNNFGGWGQDPNYYLTFENARKLKSLLVDAVNEDRAIKDKLEKLISVAKP